MDENTQSSETEKSSKQKKAVTIYIPDTQYKKLMSSTSDKTEKQIGALATKCFSYGLKKLKSRKVTETYFE
tara:strand:+ start:812 stop:1024 length:213 start_codon:yes stop_codon:yes gene_type:complete